MTENMRVKHGEIRNAVIYNYNKRSVVVKKEKTDFWYSTRYIMEKKTFAKSKIAVVERVANS